MKRSDLINAQEAAKILERSKSSVSLAISDGRFQHADPSRKLLHRPGLEVRFAKSTKRKTDARQKEQLLKAQLPVPGREEQNRSQRTTGSG